MKIKKPTTSAGTGGAAIAARFRLDADPDAAKRADSAAPGKVAVTICLVAALATTALIGVLTLLKYISWDAIHLR